MPRQAGWGRRAGRRTDDGGPAEGKPRLGWGQPMTGPRPHRAHGRRADAGGHRAGALAGGHPCLDRRAAKAPPGGDMPPGPSARRREVVVRQARGHPLAGGRCLRGGIPRQALGDHRRVDGSTPQTLGSAGALGSHALAVGGARARAAVAQGAPAPVGHGASGR
jgi:hypothetical protein